MALKSKPTSISIENIRSHIVGIDVEVPLLNGSLRPYVFFDNAASTPCLRPVAEKVGEFLGWYSSVHRGAGYKSQVSTQLYEESRRVVLEFVGADPDRDIVIFGKNTTEALNKAAGRFPFNPDQVVLTTMMEHHSNDLPWRKAARVEHISVKPNGALDMEDLDEKLAQHTGNVPLVVISGGTNVTGFINPMHTIAEKAHAAGAMILVDAAQLAPHRGIDMLPHGDPRHIDFIVLAAHKMYAPFGVGALIGPRHIFESGAPDVVGGGTVRRVTQQSVEWAGLPEKEEAGSPNVVGTIALAKAMLTLEQIGFDAIVDHEADLTAGLLEGLQAIDGVTVYGDTDPATSRDRLGVIPLQVEGVSHYLLAAILSVEYGIGARNGLFCAHPYLYELMDIDDEESGRQWAEVEAGNRANLPGLVRVSFGMYNTKSEVDWFLDALRAIARHEYQGSYHQDIQSGDFIPDKFRPEMTSYFSL